MNADGNTTRLDEVSVFGDKLRFLIPHEWVEEDEEEGTYLYHSPDADSGWFRVSLITVKTVEPPEERLRELFGKYPVVDQETGNLVEASEKDSLQDGVPIHIYYWKVAKAVPPNLVREAVFSYTILLNRRNERSNERLVDILGQLASQATFVPQA